MNILVSNDDGIQAQGIKELVKALSKEANVYVSAPASQRSASSHALSVNDKITMKKVDFDYATMAFEVSGTPADCVKLGLYVLKEKGINIDIVYSGINHGGNLGTDTMYSGTVSAAAEGLFRGLPAVAVSVNSHEAQHFEGACILAADVLTKVIKDKENLGVVSINTPDLPVSQIKGVKTAKLGDIRYHEWFNVINEKDGEVTYTYSGVATELDHWTDDTDAKLIREGYATISSVKYDQNDYHGNMQIDKWEVQI